MEEFKRTKLIVARGKKIMQLKSLEELVDKILGDNYKNLSQKEKLQERYKNALPLSILKDIPIVYSEKGIIKKDRTIDKEKPFEIKESFVIDDETTFILSLCKLNDIRILERKDANIFLAEQEKQSMQEIKGNYVFINAKVDDIMKRHLQQKRKVGETEITK